MPQSNLNKFTSRFQSRFPSQFFQSQPFGLGLLIIVMVIWGSTFPLMKNAIDTLSPAALAATRFSIAALALLPFLGRLYPQLVWDGAVLGGLFFLTMFTQLKGLETIPANRAAFICGFNVVLVPLLAPAFYHWFGRRQSPQSRGIQFQKWTAALFALAGLGIMFGGAASWSSGDLWMLFCALAFALHLLYLELISHRHRVIAITGVQLLVVAGMSLIWAAPILKTQVGEITNNWWLLVYLGLVVSVLSTSIQMVAQRLVSAPDTALMCTLEPVFATVFAFFLLGEQMNLQGWLGAIVIVAAMLQSQGILPMLFDRAFRSQS
jgi:drug/metabolite transporter (DMT)-like permease